MNQPKKTRAKKKPNYYFTKDHENAIIEYCDTECSRRKTEIYVKMLQPAFGEMVDKIVFTYKFTTLPNIDSLRDECKGEQLAWLRHPFVFAIRSLDVYAIDRLCVAGDAELSRRLALDGFWRFCLA